MKVCTVVEKTPAFHPFRTLAECLSLIVADANIRFERHAGRRIPVVDRKKAVVRGIARYAGGIAGGLDPRAG